MTETPDVKSGWRPRLKKWTIGAFCTALLFIVSPFSDPFKAFIKTLGDPVVDRALNDGAGDGVDAVKVSNAFESKGMRFLVLGAPVKVGDKFPSGGCDDPSYMVDHKAVPTYWESYREVVSPRSDVALVGARFIVDSATPISPSSDIGCEGGGDGATTFLSFDYKRSSGVTLSTSGPGSQASGKSVFLPMDRGVSHRIAIVVSVSDNSLLVGHGEFYFMVNNERIAISTPQITVAGKGERKIPMFTGESGAWRLQS